MNLDEAFKILDIPSTVKPNDIKDLAKKNFRKLSMIHHPDCGGTSEGFERIEKAYRFLCNPEGTGANSSASATNIFNQSFTSMPSHVNMNNYVVTNTKIPLDVTTTELFHGTTKTLTLKIQKAIQQKATPYPLLETVINSYQVDIIPGSVHGQEMIIPNGGNQNILGVAGDLIIIINEINDTVFHRDKNNLIYNAEVTLRDALLGGTLVIAHPCGNELIVKYQLKSPYDKVILACKGMPIYGTVASYGDLRIDFNVKFPQHIPQHMLIDLEGVLCALCSGPK